MDDLGDIGYILFFVFLLIVNAIAAANKKRRKQQQQRQREQQPQQPQPESGERTKSLEEVMREIFGETTPKPPPPPQRKPEPTPVSEAPVRRRTTSEDIEAQEMSDMQQKFSNPMQEVMARITDPAAMAKRKADQEQLAKIFAQKPRREHHKRRYRINPRQAVLYSEILMKPRWRGF